MTHLKVIIRVRPLSQREKENETIPIIDIHNKNTVAITNIKVPEANAGDSRQRVRRFTFDCCFGEDATQDDIFSKVEEVVSRAIKRRHHSCVLAYGQSSTGKTHTMMGFPHDPGLTPRLSQKIFEFLRESSVGNEIDTMKTTISYLEIYNEKVRDLLIRDGTQTDKTLRVREHPKKGPYVQGLSEYEVRGPEDLLNWIRLGNENRRVASTLSNQHSSRSHSVVTITCDGVKLYLVDLAGSERAGNKFYTTSRFREGANINRSLVALGNVISALAVQPIRIFKSIRRRFVPFRDSILTWLLKDTLGGNSNTVMIATISPSSGCYSETVNTLRFGQRAKLIVSCPVVNEDPKERIIAELRTEVAKLRELLKEAQISGYMLDHKSINSNETENFTNSTVSEICENESSNFPDLEVVKEELILKQSDSDPCNDYVDYLGIDRVKSIEEFPLNCIIKFNNEELIPLMNVRTNISTDTKTLPNFRRVASVDSSDNMDRSRTPSFGSQDSLPPTKPPIVGSKTLPRTLLGQKPLASTRNLSSSNPTIRRRSVDKSSSIRTLFQRKSVSELPKKLEKSVETDGPKSPVKSKVDSRRKPLVKPRSDIVANVTKRLYLKSKSKEVGTDMSDIDKLPTEVPKELTICSNARQRLKEITQKALRAHRFRQVETQTDTVVLRVKEVATDIQDLRLHVAETKDVETDTPRFETNDVSVGCSFLDNFKIFDSSDFMKVTKTCAVQCDEVVPFKKDSNSPKRELSPSRVSFTKYLQQFPPLRPSVECVNPSISNPIYANSVNINVSHHYVNGKRLGSISDDSIEDQSSSNMLFPTPDLISNHNSLDPNIHATQNEQPSPHDSVKIQYAEENVHHELLYCSYDLENVKPKEELAKLYNIAKLNDVETIISLPQETFVPQINYVNEMEACVPFKIPQFLSKKAAVVEEKEGFICETITINEPKTLKSCIKVISNQPMRQGRADTSNSNMKDEIIFKEVPDSLDYHKTNVTKHVHFPKKKSQNDKMFEAMSNFLKEATSLMNNITRATKEFRSNSPIMKEFDLQISLEDLESIGKAFSCERISERIVKHPIQTQTDPILSCQQSSQTNLPIIGSFSSLHEDPAVPTNKFDDLLSDTCNKLERKLKTIDTTLLGSPDSTREHSQMTSMNSFNNSSGFNEDFSLESHYDYSSLHERSYQKRKPSCSPSAFLKQLTQMRRKIIESSREDLQNNNS